MQVLPISVPTVAGKTEHLSRGAIQRRYRVTLILDIISTNKRFSTSFYVGRRIPRPLENVASLPPPPIASPPPPSPIPPPPPPPPAVPRSVTELTAAVTAREGCEPRGKWKLLTFLRGDAGVDSSYEESRLVALLVVVVAT